MDINTEIKAGLETNHILDFSDRLYKLAVGFIGVLTVFVVAWGVYQFQASPSNTPHEVSFSGEGKTFLKPDVVLVSFGVTSQAVKSQDAVDQNNQKMNAIIKAIKDLGVADKDIQTTLYNLNPVYGFENVVPQMGVPSKAGSVSAIYPYPVRGNKITGYSLEQQIQVKIRDFDKINAILDKATAGGANTAGNLQFTIDDMEGAKAQARAKAIDQAKAKADSLTKQSGLRLGKLVNVEEGYNNPYPMAGYATALEKSTTAPSIQAGQLEIDANVTLTYQVR